MLVVLWGFFVLTGCSSFSTEKPPVPDSTFRRVLMEMQLVKARASLEPPLPPGIRDSIFTRYGLQPEDYEATLAYYSRRPQAFETLYQSVIDSLRATRNAIQGNAPPNMPDSLTTPERPGTP